MINHLDITAEDLMVLQYNRNIGRREDGTVQLHGWPNIGEGHTLAMYPTIPQLRQLADHFASLANAIELHHFSLAGPRPASSSG